MQLLVLVVSGGLLVGGLVCVGTGLLMFRLRRFYAGVLEHVFDSVAVRQWAPRVWLAGSVTFGIIGAWMAVAAFTAGS